MHGTVDEVVARSGLTTYTVSGEGAGRLASALADAPGVEMVTPFGNSLHISGRDKAALEAAIAPHRSDPALHWAISTPSLEDVFIELMTHARDNFQ